MVLARPILPKFMSVTMGVKCVMITVMKTTIYIEEDLHKRLRQEALDEGTTMSEIIRTYCEDGRNTVHTRPNTDSTE